MGMKPSNEEAASRRSLLQQVADAGRRLSTAMVLFHGALANRVGLGATDEKVLELVSRHGRPSARDLAKHTGLAPNSITSVLDRLTRSGFVRREADPEDGRRVLVVATDEGVARIAQHFVGMMTRLAELNGRYSTQELALIADYLERAAVIQEDEARKLATNDAPRV